MYWGHGSIHRLQIRTCLRRPSFRGIYINGVRVVLEKRDVYLIPSETENDTVLLVIKPKDSQSVLPTADTENVESKRPQLTVRSAQSD